MSDSAIIIEEVGLREGLQSNSVLLSLEDKIRLVDACLAAGLTRIQLGSFVNPRRVPQMSGVEDLFRHYRGRQDSTFSALVLNRRGLDRALACGARTVTISLSASDAHQRENAGKSIDASLGEIGVMIAAARQQGLTVRGSIQAAFGCYLEGNVAVAQVVRLARTMAAQGAHQIDLSDTAGFARPGTLRRVVRAVQNAIPSLPLALHLHNTLGMGLANVLMAIDLGVRIFDSAIAGMGGCPFMPGADGNIATEDLVFMLQSLEMATEIDLGKLCDGARLARHLFHQPFPGKVSDHFQRLSVLGLAEHQTG